MIKASWTLTQAVDTDSLVVADERRDGLPTKSFPLRTTPGLRPVLVDFIDKKLTGVEKAMAVNKMKAMLIPLFANPRLKYELKLKLLPRTGVAKVKLDMFWERNVLRVTESTPGTPESTVELSLSAYPEIHDILFTAFRARGGATEEESAAYGRTAALLVGAVFGADFLTTELALKFHGGAIKWTPKEGALVKLEVYADAEKLRLIEQTPGAPNLEWEVHFNENVEVGRLLKDLDPAGEVDSLARRIATRLGDVFERDYSTTKIATSFHHGEPAPLVARTVHFEIRPEVNQLHVVESGVGGADGVWTIDLDRELGLFAMVKTLGTVPAEKRSDRFREIAIETGEVIGGRDFARTNIRLVKQGTPFVESSAVGEEEEEDEEEDEAEEAGEEGELAALKVLHEKILTWTHPTPVYPSLRSNWFRPKVPQDDDELDEFAGMPRLAAEGEDMDYDEDAEMPALEEWVDPKA